MLKDFNKKVFSVSTVNLVFLTVGLLLAIGISVVYATWDEAKTGGSGSLSEANWNALVTQLETSVTPIGWTCQNVRAFDATDVTAACPSPKKLITGGCISIAGKNAWINNAPNNNGWRCNIADNGGLGTGASAWCCQ